MMGDPLLWATSAALIIWVGFYLRVLRYRTVRPAQRAALMAGYFEHCTPDGNVPAIVGPDGRVSLRARRLFTAARVRPALFLYAAGSSRGASFNHGRRRSAARGLDGHHHPGRRSRGAIGSRPIRYRPWGRAVVVIGAAGYRGPGQRHQRRRPGRLECRQPPTRGDLENRPSAATNELASARTHSGPDRSPIQAPRGEPLQAFPCRRRTRRRHWSQVVSTNWSPELTVRGRCWRRLPRGGRR